MRDFRSGVWVRDVLKDPGGGVEAFRFINVMKVSPDAGTTSDWRIFEFDREYRLRSITTAESGAYAQGAGWTLTNVVETRLPQLAAGAVAQTSEGTRVIRDETRTWRSELRPDIFGVLMVQPERMAGLDLAQYIRHLAENRQQTGVYEIAFWSKLFYPWAVLVMMALALPFAYLHVRAGGLSLKIFTGVMIGVGFYGLNKLFAHLGMLNTWPPIFVAALPSLVVLALAMSALYWIERRYSECRPGAPELGTAVARRRPSVGGSTLAASRRSRGAMLTSFRTRRRRHACGRRARQLRCSGVPRRELALRAARAPLDVGAARRAAAGRRRATAVPRPRSRATAVRDRAADALRSARFSDLRRPRAASCSRTDMPPRQRPPSAESSATGSS